MSVKALHKIQWNLRDRKYAYCFIGQNPMYDAARGKGKPILVGIGDDQQLVRHGFHYIINAQEDMEVVGEASDGREAVLLANRARPHVLLMDVQMPEYSGIDANHEILPDLPDCKIVILTTFDLEEYVYDDIRVGAVGYLLKDAA